MRYFYSGISHKGKKRKRNEDFYHAEFPIFVVADGLGGHRAGEVASQLAVKNFVDRVRKSYAEIKNTNELVRLMERSIVEAGRIVLEESKTSSELQGMGTTISAAVIFSDYLVTAHVGDSRIHLYRKGELKKLTKDHTYVQYLLDKGEISQEEAESHPLKNALLQALGGEEKLNIDTGIFALKPGDKVLLCTDGLYTMVSDDFIKEVLQSNHPVTEKTRQMLETALKAGGKDNITLIIIEAVDEA